MISILIYIQILHIYLLKLNNFTAKTKIVNSYMYFLIEVLHETNLVKLKKKL